MALEQDDQQYYEEDNNHSPNDVPLVVPPYYILERPQKRCESQEGGGWAVWLLQVWVHVGIITALPTSFSREEGRGDREEGR